MIPLIRGKNLTKIKVDYLYETDQNKKSIYFDETEKVLRNANIYMCV